MKEIWTSCAKGNLTALNLFQVKPRIDPNELRFHERSINAKDAIIDAFIAIELM
jgi:hypothetical protein